MRTSKSIVTQMVSRSDVRDQEDIVNDLLEINELDDLEGDSAKSDDNAPKKKNLLKTTLLSQYKLMVKHLPTFS